MQNKQGNRISMTVMSVKTKELNEKATNNKKKDDAKEEKREIILAATLIISLEKIKPNEVRSKIFFSANQDKTNILFIKQQRTVTIPRKIYFRELSGTSQTTYNYHISSIIPFYCSTR